MYKKSNYNMLIPYDDEQTIIFNSFSGAVGVFDKETLRQYKSDSIPTSKQEMLIKKGILVKCDFDEKAEMLNDRKMGNDDPSRQVYRIWTTSAFNARCFYCFEKGINTITMSPETSKDVIAFMISQSKNHDRPIHIEWFGGEPLLNTSCIDIITDGLRSKNIPFYGDIITNGSLITDDIIQKMKGPWHITACQITLDGDESEYRSIKNYYDPEHHNFRSVINNIKLVADSGIHVAVRLNYNSYNGESLIRLIEYLHFEIGVNDNINYYIYPIWGSTNIDDPHRFISHTTSDNDLFEASKLLVKYGMSSILEVSRLNRKNYMCMSCNRGSFAIFPDGTLGKCSEAFNFKIGNIWDGVVNDELCKVWESHVLSQECNDCNLLPLCQGGCMTSKLIDSMSKCYAYKEVLPDFVKYYVEESMREQSFD